MDSLTHAVVGASVASVGLSLSSIDQVLQIEMMFPAILVGFIAGLLPDLDYLFIFFKKPLLAWKYHRVALHNVFVLPFLALIALLLSNTFLFIYNNIYENSIHFDVITENFILFYFLAVASLISHLILDYITSFGSSFFYPFTRKRFAIGTHFLTDPFILLLAVVGLFFDFQFVTLICIVAYIVFGLTLKKLCTWNLKRYLLDNNVKYSKVNVFPKIGAPFRWLAILVEGDKYGIVSFKLFFKINIKWVEKGVNTKSYQLHQLDPLIKYFVSISKHPRFEDCEREGKPAIAVEDIQWWFSLPKRPMAFSAFIENDLVTEVKESNKLDTGPAGEPNNIKYIENDKI